MHKAFEFLQFLQDWHLTLMFGQSRRLTNSPGVTLVPAWSWTVIDMASLLLELLT